MNQENNRFIPDENFRRAWDFVERTGVNVFLTGKAGTGKTTFLRQVMKNSAKTAVVVAPTGVAAINAGGVTIHSFFQLSPAPFVPGAETRVPTFWMPSTTPCANTAGTGAPSEGYSF